MNKMEKIVTPYITINTPDDIVYPPYALKAKDTTCFTCDQKEKCKYAFDPYNTNGDCLADK